MKTRTIYYVIDKGFELRIENGEAYSLLTFADLYGNEGISEKNRAMGFFTRKAATEFAGGWGKVVKA